MTIVIGFSFPELSVLGADTRAVTFNPRTVDDNYEKVGRTGYGLISGAGSSDVVNAVAQLFIVMPPSTNHDAAESIRRLVGAMPYESTDLEITLSQWLTTYTVGAGDEARAGLAFIHSAFNYNPQTVATNSFYIIYPAGMTDDLQQAIQEKVQRIMERDIIPSPVDQRLARCIAAIHTIIKFVNSRNDTVSDRYQIGYHHVKDGAHISNLVGDVRELVFD